MIPGKVMVARALAVIAAALAAHHLVLAPFRCQRAIVPLEQQTRYARTLPPDAARRVASANLSGLEKISSGCRTDVDLHLLLSLNSRILGRSKEAMQHMENAFRVDDRPELYLHRGLIFLEMGEVDAAVQQFATAVEFNPTLINQLDPGLRARIERAVRERIPGN